MESKLSGCSNLCCSGFGSVDALCFWMTIHVTNTLGAWYNRGTDCSFTTKAAESGPICPRDNLAGNCNPLAGDY